MKYTLIVVYISNDSMLWSLMCAKNGRVQTRTNGYD